MSPKSPPPVPMMSTQEFMCGKGSPLWRSEQAEESHLGRGVESVGVREATEVPLHPEQGSAPMSREGPRTNGLVPRGAGLVPRGAGRYLEDRHSPSFQGWLTAEPQLPIPCLPLKKGAGLHLQDAARARLDHTQFLVLARGGEQAAVSVEGHAEDHV